MSRKLSQVESKIKDHVAYYKGLARDRTNYQMFNKDPIVYVGAHPEERDYGYSSKHPAGQANASLRVRSPKGTRSGTGTVSHARMAASAAQEQSSSALDLRQSDLQQQEPQYA